MEKEYEIPCIWQMYGTKKVTAESLAEAISLVETEESLPVEGTYIQGSFEVDYAIAEENYSDE